MRDDSRIIEAQGARMPSVGIGTWMLEGDECAEAVTDALRIGYRHVDTAEAYGNEADVGRGLKESEVSPEDVWVTTKVWWENLSREECIDSALASLDRLGLERVDLLLIHWPAEEVSLEEPLEAMKDLRRRGRVRHLGVSNFTPELLATALEEAPILCNQVEYHPYLGQEELLAMADEHDLVLTAYSPLAQGRVMDDPVLEEIARAHDRSVAQVCLRWLIQQPRVAAIPRSSSPEHRKENFEVFDFELSSDEMDRISGLDRGLRLVDPDFAPAWSS